jgi:hypothetical protein
MDRHREKETNMCQLCGTPEEVSAERDRLDCQAGTIERAALVLRHYASGTLKPHTTEAKYRHAVITLAVQALAEHL